MASPQVVDPVAQMWSPSRSRTTSARPGDQLHRRRAVRCPGAHPNVHRIGPGVRGDRGIRRPEDRFAEDVGGGRLADAGESVGQDGDLDPESAIAEPRQGPVEPHRPHLARRSGQGDDGATVGPGDPPTGRRAVVVGDGERRRDEPGLLEVHLGERQSAALPQGPQPGLETGIDGRNLTTGRRDRLAGQIVGRGAEAAGRHHEIGPLEGRPERSAHGRQVVGQCRQAS